MQILIRAHHRDAAAARGEAERRVRQALRRFSGAVLRADVQFAPLAAPQGAPDKQCQVVLQTSDGMVTVSSVARDFRQALREALSQVSRSLRHLWARLTAAARPRPQPRRLGR